MWAELINLSDHFPWLSLPPLQGHDNKACPGHPAHSWPKSGGGPRWAQTTAALLIIGCILAIICFILSFLALCKEQEGLLRVIGFILFVAVLIQLIGLIIYPIKFTDILIQRGAYEYSWSYGFGWGATILMIGCGIFFCCLSKYKDELYGLTKPYYIYQSP
ncbi:p53 apoptosis effector related to PMP-22 [Narcine bancroftii]|uniref:p53 apoptosis effector related to PMP-22 n=1 Tax=Narcine bancroftii TaxID=1343680 RepID=UPI003831572C